MTLVAPVLFSDKNRIFAIMPGYCVCPMDRNRLTGTISLAPGVWELEGYRMRSGGRLLFREADPQTI
jgi:hypothetical protein